MQKRDLWDFELSQKPGQHIVGQPEIRFIAGLHGNDLVGREVLLQFATYLCTANSKDESVKKVSFWLIFTLSIWQYSFVLTGIIEWIHM